MINVFWEITPRRVVYSGAVAFIFSVDCFTSTEQRICINTSWKLGCLSQGYTYQLITPCSCEMRPWIILPVSKCKGHSLTCYKGTEARSVVSLLMRNLRVRWEWAVIATPRPLYPRERDPLPIVQEPGWASGPAGRGAEKLTLTGVRTLERPLSSESLHRLRHHGHILSLMFMNLATMSDLHFSFRYSF